MIYYIYKIVLLKGSLSGKYYIGQHRTKNMDDGYVGSGTILRNYYKVYGKVVNETYTKEILCYCASIKELNEAEQRYIADRYDSDEDCINLIAGGNGKGCSKETRRKLSEASKGRIVKEESRRRIAETLKGHPVPQETRDLIREKVKELCKSPEYLKKLSEAQKRRPPITEETRRKLSESNKGRAGCWKGKKMPKSITEKMSQSQRGLIVINNGVEVKKVKTEELEGYLASGWVRGYSDEVKRKMSESSTCRGTHLSEERKQALSQKIKGRKMSEEARAKIAANNRARANDPVIRKKISDAKKGKHLSPEHIAKVAAAKRGVPQSAESNRKRSEALKGCHWYFDKQLNRRVYVLPQNH